MTPPGPAGGPPCGPEYGPEVAERARTRFPELYRVAVCGRAAFDHILQARRIRQHLRDRQDWAVSHYLEGRLRDAFEAEHGTITHAFWCQTAYGGGLVTDRGYVNSSLKSRDEELMTIEVSIKQLARDAQRTYSRELAGMERGTSHAEMVEATLPEISATLFSALSRVLDAADVLEDPQSSPAERVTAREATRAEWRLARHRATVLIQRQASWEYFVGVLAGAPLAVAVFAGLGAITATRWPDAISTSAFVAATVCGAIGGVVSVTQRMAAGRLRIDYTASRANKILLGAWRPFLGGTLGGVLQFAIIGGLLTVQGSEPSPDSPATFAFYALVGFAGGFSERLATDLLERAGTLISPPRTADGAMAAPPTAAVEAGALAVPAPREQDEDVADDGPSPRPRRRAVERHEAP